MYVTQQVQQIGGVILKRQENCRKNGFIFMCKSINLSYVQICLKELTPTVDKVL